MVIDLIILVLAGWRITSALNREKIGQSFRRILAGERNDVAGLTKYSDTFLAELIMCFMCLSFWVSIFCVVALWVYPPILYPFALSSAIILFEKVYQYG